AVVYEDAEWWFGLPKVGHTGRDRGSFRRCRRVVITKRPRWATICALDRAQLGVVERYTPRRSFSAGGSTATQHDRSARTTGRRGTGGSHGDRLRHPTQG